MRFRKGREEEPRLGLTPLIDVVFLLLIFFMLTSHFQVATGLPIRLPKVAQKSFHTPEEKVALIVDKWGHAYLEGKKIESANLGDALRDFVRQRGPVELILEADREVRHGRVVQLMDLAKGAGVSTIIIAARWDSKDAQKNEH